MAVVEFVTATSLPDLFIDVFISFAKGWLLLVEGEMPLNFSLATSRNAGCAAGLRSSRVPAQIYTYRFFSQGKGEKLEYSHVGKRQPSRVLLTGRLIW